MASTAGAYGFASNTKIKLTYNHFDSFPEGLGREIVAFIRKVEEDKGWASFRFKVDGLTMVDENAKMTEDEARKYFPRKKSFAKLPTWYEAIHNYQNGKILPAILNGEVSHMTDAKTLPKNSMFCHFVYIIDLNNMTFDVYIGQQKNADNNSYFGKDKNDEGYYPCKFVATWNLSDIPKDWEKQISDIVKADEKKVA